MRRLLWANGATLPLGATFAIVLLLQLATKTSPLALPTAIPTGQPSPLVASGLA